MTVLRTTNLCFRDELEYRAAAWELLAASDVLTEEECVEFEFDLLSAVFDQLGPRKQPELDLTELRERIALRRFQGN